MNYDLTSIPAGYDRGRDLDADVLDLWMNVVARYATGRPVSTILDLGCGTGRFSEVLAARFNARVVGIDPSAKMLEQARAKARRASVRYGRGAAEAIPLANGSVDLIFMSMSYHHFPDPQGAARECRRVLRRNGTVVIRTGTREQIPSYLYVAFLPQTRPMLEELLPDQPGLCRVFGTAGFECVSGEIVTQTVAPTWAAYADKLAAGGDSVLATLPEDELTAGLALIRNHSGTGSAVVEPIDIFFFR